MAITELDGLDQIRAAVGSDLGTSGWIRVTQEQVDLFAEATGDHQWIHVDPERAVSGPFGAAIAHGYLTLSLSNALLPEIVEVSGVTMGINYGTDKVRFPAPVVVGSRVRAQAGLASVEEVPGGVQTKMVITIEVEGVAKPACVIESISRYLI